MRSSLIFSLSLLSFFVVILDKYRNGFDKASGFRGTQLLTVGGLRSVCENEVADKGRSYSDVEIYISDCFFVRLSKFSGNGGVIYLSVGTHSMYVSYTTFFGCHSTSNGGAIFSNAINSVLNLICANNCSSYFYLFAYLGASGKNEMEYLSVSSCSDPTGYYTIYTFDGNQAVLNTNISMNKAYNVPGIYLKSPQALSSVHCTFSNNIASDSLSIFFEDNYGTMSFANIVHCNSPIYGVLFNRNGDMKMEYCIFAMNENTLFYTQSGSIEISHSYLLHSGKLSTLAAVIMTNNNTQGAIPTYQIQYFQSELCNADQPLPERTPLISPDETPFQSPFDTPFQSPFETPFQSPFETPFQSPFETPFQSPFETPFQSPFETPFQSPFETPFQSPFETPFQTPFETPFQTPFETPFQSPFETPFQSPYETPFQSPFETPFQTPFETPFQTPFETPVETIDESKSEASPVVIVAEVLLTIVILIGAGYGIGILFNRYSTNDGLSESPSDNQAAPESTKSEI